LREPGSVTRTLLHDEWSGRGLTRRESLEIETRESSREAVARGLGIGIVSRGELGSDPRLRMLAFSDWKATMSEWLICLAGRADLHLMRAVISLVDSANLRSKQG